MKLHVRIYAVVTVVLAAATILSYGRHAQTTPKTAALDTPAVVFDCCADPPPCGAPGEPVCWPPIPPDRSSN